MALLRLVFLMLKSPPDTRLMLPYLGGLCEAQVPRSADHETPKMTHAVDSTRARLHSGFKEGAA